MEVYAASKHFTNLMKKEESGAIEMVLNIMKGGLYSKSQEVATWASKVLSKMAYDLSDVESGKGAWNWFVAVDGGLDSAVYCVQKHGEMLNAVVEMMVNFGRQNLSELFTQLLKNVVADGTKYWRLVGILVKPLADLILKLTSDESLRKDLDPTLFFWLDSTSRIADNDGRHTLNERASALGVLTELWIHFPECVETRESLAERVLSVLRRATRDKCSALQTFAFAHLFVLLEQFATGKKQYAPTLYKSLAFTFLETHAQEDTREFIMGNLGALFSSMPAIPISIVTEPLVKQVQASENVTYFFNLFDFEFVALVAGHPKLTIKNAIQLMDMLAKTIVNDPLFSPVAVQPFVKIAARFRGDQDVADLLAKFVDVLFSAHYA